jgi:HSP20 family molecular chaperone IbpA
MLFASTHPALRHHTYAQTSRSLERFLSEARAYVTQPSTQFKQDDVAFHLKLDMPGISKEQLSISIEGPEVRILSREGATRQYRAAFELPQDIDASLSQAKLEHGVLTLKLAKKAPVIQAIEIAVN